MIAPGAADVERARRLLAHEGASGSSATAASRVFETIHAHLAQLVGDAGVQMLFARSAKLACREHPCLENASFARGPAELRGCLEATDPAAAGRAAEALFATFFALVETLIGERLITQVLRRAWPTVIAVSLEK